MAAAPPASASSAGHQHAVKLQMMDDNNLQDDDDVIPLVFRWVMAAAASSSSPTTIGEKNKENNFCRAAAWIILVSMPSICIATSAASAYAMYDESFWGPGFPWYIPVVMLWGIYMAVVHLAMYHLTLFLPQAPYAAREALWHVGFEKIGLPLGLTSALVLPFDQYARWVLIAWCCVAGLLVAAVVAFWICLVRMYGDWETSIRGLARGLAVSSLLTAALTAFMIHPQFVCSFFSV